MKKKTVNDWTLCYRNQAQEARKSLPNMSLPNKRKYSRRHYDFSSYSWCSVSDKLLFQFNQFPKVRSKDLSSYFAQTEGTV